MPPWPPMPAEVLPNRRRPRRGFVTWLHSHGSYCQFPMAATMFGSSIRWRLEICRVFGLMEELLSHEFPFPWCHHLRFIIREEPDVRAGRFSLALPASSDTSRILAWKPSNAAWKRRLRDESLPLLERLAPLPIMAGNDFALGRYPEAMEKYELLLRYHAPLNNYPMAAFALNGMGEVYEKNG